MYAYMYIHTYNCIKHTAIVYTRTRNPARQAQRLFEDGDLHVNNNNSY